MIGHHQQKVIKKGQSFPRSSDRSSSKEIMTLKVTRRLPLPSSKEVCFVGVCKSFALFALN
jgi:hypothetical protein